MQYFRVLDPWEESISNRLNKDGNCYYMVPGRKDPTLPGGSNQWNNLNKDIYFPLTCQIRPKNKRLLPDMDCEKNENLGISAVSICSVPGICRLPAIVPVEGVNFPVWPGNMTTRDQCAGKL